MTVDPDFNSMPLFDDEISYKIETRLLQATNKKLYDLMNCAIASELD